MTPRCLAEIPTFQDDLHDRVSNVVEAAGYSKGLLNSYQTTRGHVPGDMPFPQYLCDDLESRKLCLLFYDIYRKACTVTSNDERFYFNPLNAELNPIRHLLALVGDHHFVDVSIIRVNISNLSKYVRSIIIIMRRKLTTGCPAVL
jgi:hypothetical protein